MNAKLTEQVKIFFFSIKEGSAKYEIMAKGMFTLATGSWGNLNL